MRDTQGIQMYPLIGCKVFKVKNGKRTHKKTFIVISNGAPINNFKSGPSYFINVETGSIQRKGSKIFFKFLFRSNVTTIYFGRSVENESTSRLRNF